MERVIDYLLRNIPVSYATIRNWQKEGLLPSFPPEAEENELRRYLQLVGEVSSARLVARANRIANQTVSPVRASGISPTAGKALRKAAALARDCHLESEAAVKVVSLLMLRRGGLLIETCPHSNAGGGKETRIDRLYAQWILPLSERQKVYGDLLCGLDIPFDCDFLGLLYQALRTVGGRARSGAFYTPKQAVPFLGAAGPSFTVYDPCCGSGALLTAALSPDSDSGCVYASDIDETALRLCEVNLALFFNDPDFRSHLFVADVLDEKPMADRFDAVLANPPWGLRRSGSGSSGRKKECTEKGDSFGQILLRALSWLNPRGQWFFFLPVSFLTVRRHAFIRKVVLSRNERLKVTLLGNIFPGVLSEAVLAEGRLRADGESEDSLPPRLCRPTVQPLSGEPYRVDVPAAPHYVIEAFASPREKELWQRLYRVEHRRLGSLCGFILGIVTGHNDRLTADRPSEGVEAVYRGCDVFPFRFGPPAKWMRFEKKRLRQCAPEERYRQPKIVYRFIGDRICCLYDTGGSLILNSANALYPKTDYPPETLVCLLNSCFTDYIIRKRYHTKKILRSYLEDLPVPLLPDALHEEFGRLYRRIVSEKKLTPETDALLTLLSAQAFGLSADEAAIYRDDSEGRRSGLCKHCR